MNFLGVTNGYWEMTMVVERGHEPMDEKGRGYGLARRYHYSQFQRRVRRRADGRKTGLS